MAPHYGYKYYNELLNDIAYRALTHVWRSTYLHLSLQFLDFVRLLDTENQV